MNLLIQDIVGWDTTVPIGRDQPLVGALNPIPNESKGNKTK